MTILLFVNDLRYFISHRLLIAHAAVKSSFEVHVAYGELGGTDDGALNALGLTLHFVPIQRGGMNPLADVRSVFLLCALCRRLRPDLVHLVTIKPVLYGGMAACLARVPAAVSAMAGLGCVVCLLNKAG